MAIVQFCVSKLILVGRSIAAQQDPHMPLPCGQHQNVHARKPLTLSKETRKGDARKPLTLSKETRKGDFIGTSRAYVRLSGKGIMWGFSGVVGAGFRFSICCLFSFGVLGSRTGTPRVETHEAKFEFEPNLEGVQNTVLWRFHA